MFALALAMMIQASEAPATSPAASPLIDPIWIRRPTGNDMASVFPEAAFQKYLTGFGTISCTVTAAGELSACVVSAEGPAGEGFGNAALRLAYLFRMRATSQSGQPVVGKPVRIPMRFTSITDLRAGPIKARNAALKDANVAVNCRYQQEKLDNCYAEPGRTWSQPASAAATALVEAMSLPHMSRPSGRIVVEVQFVE